MLDLFALNTNELTGRVFLGRTSEESRTKMKYFYLNHDESEFERWDTHLLNADGKPGLSLTYGVKEFIISYHVKKTRSSELYAAHISDIKRKVLGDSNQLKLSVSLEKHELGEYKPIKGYDVEVNWGKGKPLHDLWVVLANEILEDFLGVTNKSDELLLEGRLLKN